ncbi:MAG: gamma carbonic anhydrase family protein [Candidatus Helarchaeota archaeon]|nr:gamma carbonic anhydrase family protein [Candidatus Helarchaeota archaeon]
MFGRFASYQPKIAPSAFIAPNSVIVGNVTIGENCVIWFGVVIRGAENEIIIGEQTIIEDNCVIHGTNPIRIGNNVIIGHNSVIHSCRIEDEVLIGPNVCIYDGAEIEKGAMIGINSVIQPKQKIESEKFYQGNPIAKKIKKVKVDLERNRRYIEKNIVQAREFKKKFVKI